VELFRVSAPSPWVQRFTPPEPGTALDVACGAGRHFHWLAGRGWQVTGVDRDTSALNPVGEIVTADIEAGPWPLAGRTFELVLVCNYLWRPLFAPIQGCVAPGGWLIWETFADGQQHIGRPRRADFLLQRGELLAVCAGWQIVAFEDVFEDGVNPRFVQRVAARRPACAQNAGP
jgi:SAM-dependent methyltransferase